MKKPILVTLTAPTCSGKSHLLNYIRDTAGLPCFVSTTTREPRAGEREGRDYYFISLEKSLELQEAGEFVELAVFNGHRYGITRTEFDSKMALGLVFFIVEPSGLEHHVKSALASGALWLRYFILVDEDTQINRFKSRFDAELHAAAEAKDTAHLLRLLETYTTRLQHMLRVESRWLDMYKWDLVLRGDRDPASNLQRILKNIDSTTSFLGCEFPDVAKIDIPIHITETKLGENNESVQLG